MLNENVCLNSQNHGHQIFCFVIHISLGLVDLLIFSSCVRPRQHLQTVFH